MATSKLRIVTVLAACLLVTGSAGFGVYQYLKTEHQREAEVDIRLRMQALQDDLQAELGGMSNILSFLVDQVENHLSVDDPESFQRLSYDFLSFVRTAQIYDQIRLIDMTGKEIVRANYNNGKPALVPAGELQNKSDRYYFQEGMKLKRDQVYVSPFDLNIEHGEIEKPLKPSIRLVEAAFNAEGEQVGLVVVNLLGEPLLTRIRMQARLISVDNLSLLNRDGYWLQGPVEDDMWAFMYPQRQARSMAVMMPEVWQQILDSDQARVRSADGIYLSSTLYPARIFGRGGVHVGSKGEHFWKLAAYYPDRLVDVALTDQFRLIAAASVGSGVALAIILLVMLRLRRQTELRRAAEERNLQQVMENDRSRAIVTIAGGMAHEFNNILAGILGSAYLLRTNLKDRPELLGRLDTIEHLGERAGELVQLLMTFAQVDYKVFDRLSLNELLEGMLQEIRQSLPGNVLLETAVTDIPLYLLADKGKLEKMVKELISNAADAVAEVDRPEIRISLDFTDGEIEGVGDFGRRYARLTLTDNGCGISPENLPHIFDPFYTTKETGKGTGMGLALVHGVVHALHGDIRVAGNDGRGTIVRVYLPLAESGSG